MEQTPEEPKPTDEQIEDLASFLLPTPDTERERDVRHADLLHERAALEQEYQDLLASDDDSPEMRQRIAQTRHAMTDVYNELRQEFGGGRDESGEL